MVVPYKFDCDMGSGNANLDVVVSTGCITVFRHALLGTSLAGDLCFSAS